MNEQTILLIGLFSLFFLYKRFRINQARAQLAELNFEDTQLLDVRSEAEFAGFNAPGSINIPVQSLIAGNTKGLNKDKVLVVYCASGMRSGSACLSLKKQGYKVINAGTVGNVIRYVNS